jgi:hypothetical protein
LASVGFLLACSATPSSTRRLDAEIVESSGVVASRLHPGVLWHHSDSETAAVLYATALDGSLIAAIRSEAQNVDWEDIATDDAGHLYVGDMGDNKEARDDLVLYVFDEPDPRETRGSGARLPAREVPFRYPDPLPEGSTSRDAESLFFWEGRLYLLTKRWSDRETILFRFPDLTGSSSEALVLERISKFDLGGPALIGGMATAADVSPSGSHLAVLSYHAIFIFDLAGGPPDALSGPHKAIRLQSTVTRQCEAITWVGDSLVMTNESGRLFWIEDPLSPTRTRFPAEDLR